MADQTQPLMQHHNAPACLKMGEHNCCKVAVLHITYVLLLSTMSCPCTVSNGQIGAQVQVDDEMIFMPTAEHVTDAPLSHPRSSHRRGGMLLRADDRPLEPAHAPSPGLDPYLLL